MTTRGTQDSTIELLCAHLALIEPALVLVDSRVRLDEDVVVDVLARDSLGYPLVILFSEGDVTRDLGRMAKVDMKLHQGRHFVERLYGDKGLDPNQRPRFALLARRFPDDAPRLLDLLAEVEVQAFEYRVVRSGDAPPVLDLAAFHRTSGPRPAPVTPRPERSAMPLPSAVPGGATRATLPGKLLTKPAGQPPKPPFATTAAPTLPPAGAGADPDAGELELIPETPAGKDDLFARARDTIAGLSRDVAESEEEGRTVFRMGGELLAALRRDELGCLLWIGEQGPPVPLLDAAGLDEQLGRLFDLFFNRAESPGFQG